MFDVSNLYYWGISISQHNTERLNAWEPSRKDFQNSIVPKESIEMGQVSCQPFRNTH